MELDREILEQRPLCQDAEKISVNFMQVKFRFDAEDMNRQRGWFGGGFWGLRRPS